MRIKDDIKETNIRKVAIKMIVEKGFDGLSMQKLAKAAQISPSTIYVYFKNREDLLNQLYLDVQEKFEKDALKDFDPEMNFEKGLWLQWLNRYKNIKNNPTEFYFSEQFRNSPLIKQSQTSDNAFRDSMNLFVTNAITHKEIMPMSKEIFWAIAYGAFYILIKFHLDQATMAGTPFQLSESKLKQAFDLVLKSFRL
jgi:AcrR family transcriptional regulator